MQFERSKEWWMARLAGETDVAIGAAGGLAESGNRGRSADLPATASFSEFVHLLRRRECLSVDQFAETVDIDLSDAQAIEEDPFYRVDFRTVWAISQRFGLPQAKLNEMAGVVVANDVEPFIDQRRYAARSELRSVLSADEVALFNIVVAVATERMKG